MASQESTIKAAIKTILDALVTAGTIKQVVSDDCKKPINLRDISLFPCAIISDPAIDSDTETNCSNTRTYEFQILITDKIENISSNDQISDLREAIMNAIDNDYTLGGAADGGVDPSMSRPEPDEGNNHIGFIVTIKAKALYSRT